MRFLLCVFAWMVCGAQTTAAHGTGCAGTGLAGGLHTLSHRGLLRTYRLHLPLGYSAAHAAPLVIVFHGWGGDENEFLADPAVAREADARGYIVVAPRGLGAGPPDHRRNSWTFRGSASGLASDVDGRAAICDTATTPDYRYPSCTHGIARNSCSWTQCQDDDVDFSRELVRHLENSLCIDSSRVFAAGGSNGGMFTWELGQNAKTAPLFRALASLVGLPHRGHPNAPARPAGLPMLLITGTRDTTVPPGAWDDERFTTSSNAEDRFHYTAATAITRRWAAAAGCDIRRPATRIDTGTPQAECRSTCPASDGRWPTVMDCRAPMGHEYGLAWSWPLILDFFDRS